MYIFREILTDMLYMHTCIVRNMHRMSHTLMDFFVSEFGQARDKTKTLAEVRFLHTYLHTYAYIRARNKAQTSAESLLYIHTYINT
jgi:hypothetical protein